MNNLNNDLMCQCIVKELNSKSLARRLLEVVEGDVRHNGFVAPNNSVVPLLDCGYNVLSDTLKNSRYPEITLDGVNQNIATYMLEYENNLLFNILRKAYNEYKIHNIDSNGLLNSIRELEKNYYVAGSILVNHKNALKIKMISRDISFNNVTDNIQDSIFNVGLYGSELCNDNEIYVLASKDKLGVFNVNLQELTINYGMQKRRMEFSYFERIGMFIFDDTAILRVMIDSDMNVVKHNENNKNICTHNKYRFISRL
jgi:hypothetical protein